ncbi:type IV pilus modification protein PilV [Ottowia testudinis]|uniref:Type IV pilus modification protein PilV n=1 Tax=Ottowia testudinis TaxID=2816950 RepID=A0A975CJQ7_9BURK|nr:type IV pilus modification protein PilV [Ottowia testudinis]
MLEVLVSILVVAIGLLGLAKMQALALVGASTSNNRTLVAAHTASLAAAMHANRAYWGAFAADTTISSDAAEITGPPASVPAEKCKGTGTDKVRKCTPAQFAAVDLDAWVKSMNAALPGFKSQIVCTRLIAANPPAVPRAVPSRCMVTVNWNERYANAGKSTAIDSAATGGERTFIVHIQP